MCGVAGVFFTDPGRVADASLLDRMNATLAHRGPDDAGIHRDGPIGLANRGLAIIDLSPRARQPMSNEAGSLTITFNGEIYDFYVLRASLSHRGDTFLDHWLRQDLREMSHELLLDARARQLGYLRPEAVQRYPKEHGEGRADHHARLWTLLNPELWHRMFVDQTCPTAPPVRR